MIAWVLYYLLFVGALASGVVGAAIGSPVLKAKVLSFITRKPHGIISVRGADGVYRDFVIIWQTGTSTPVRGSAYYIPPSGASSREGVPVLYYAEGDFLPNIPRLVYENYRMDMVDVDEKDANGKPTGKKIQVPNVVPVGEARRIVTDKLPSEEANMSGVKADQANNSYFVAIKNKIMLAWQTKLMNYLMLAAILAGLAFFTSAVSVFWLNSKISTMTAMINSTSGQVAELRGMFLK